MVITPILTDANNPKLGTLQEKRKKKEKKRKRKVIQYCVCHNLVVNFIKYNNNTVPSTCSNLHCYKNVARSRNIVTHLSELKVKHLNFT